MLRGLTGTPVRFYWIYVFLNWSIFFYFLVAGFISANGIAIRLDNQEADRWTTFLFYRFAITIFVLWMPAWFMHQFMYHNLSRWRYTLFLVVAIVVGLWLGFMIATLIIDVTNCINISYCVDPKFPPTYERPDATWYIFFFGCIYCVIFIVVWIILGNYIRNRLEYRAILDYYHNPNRNIYNPAYCSGIYSQIGQQLPGSTLPVNMPIGAHIDGTAQKHLLPHGNFLPAVHVE